MQLDGLRPLYQSMCAQDLGRVKFRYNLNHLVFDCLFFADTRPFELVMGCLGHNFAIFLEVHNGFVIRPFIEPTETFNALCEALFQGKGSANRFQASAFFAEFSRHIPAQTTRDQAASADDVLRHYPDIEEAHKRWFCGWLDNTKQGNRVTPANLVKTRRLMNQAAHDFALRRNMSTRWTHEESRAMEMFFPEYRP